MAGTQLPNPFPVPSFHPGQSGETTPSEFLEFLRKLISENLGDKIESIPSSEKEGWVTMIIGLSEHFLAAFPTSSSASWTAMREKIDLCCVSLDVIQRAALRAEELSLDSDARIERVMYRLLGFLITLGSWDKPIQFETNEAPTPLELRSKTIQAIAASIRSFKNGASGNSTVYRRLIGMVLAMVKEMLDLQPVVIWPLTLDLSRYLDALKANSIIDYEFKVENVNQLYAIISDLLRFSVLGLGSDRTDSSFIQEFDRETAQLIRRTFNALLTSSALSSNSRIENLASITESSQMHRSTSVTGCDVLATIPTILLLFRLKSGPNTDWQPVDRILLATFNSGACSLQPHSASQFALEVILREEWGDDGQSLIACTCSAIRSTLKELEPQTLQSMRDLLSKPEIPTSIGALLATIDAVSDQNQLPDSTLGKRKREDDSWKNLVIELLRKDIFVKDEHWMPDEQLKDASWVTSLMDILKAKFTQPLANSSTEYRTTATVALKKLACAIAHPDQTNCFQVSRGKAPALSLIPTYLACLTCLQAGDEGQVKPIVLRAVQDALAACLKHHARGFSEEKLDAVSELIQTGLQSQDRLTRLASGRALMELIGLYQRIGRGSEKRMNHVFDAIDDLLEKGKDGVKETTLITVGLVGKTPDNDILGRALYCLFAQLDCNSILLKGVTYMQLLGLAKHHEKTPYLLVAPHLSHIAAQVVSIMSQRPNTLLETCRFLSLSPNDFLSVTIPHTLPYLFSTCNLAALEKLSKELGKSISSLFLNTSAEILAQVFLLKGPENTDIALDFILRTLSEAANKITIGLSNVVKSAIIPLLGKLVIAMGDEDAEAAENAKQAIRKVERVLGTGANDHITSTQHLGSFLKGYMLGIIAILNDVLQDVQGRKTDDAKRKVLFGLNALIKEVGPSINAVAPQIMATLQTTICALPLSDAALQTWYSFIVTLSLRDLGPHVGPTTAALINVWHSFSLKGRRLAEQIVNYIVMDARKELGSYLDEIVDLSGIPELAGSNERMISIKRNISTKDRLVRLLERLLSDNATVVGQALEELKIFMLAQHAEFIREIASGDVFNPLVGQITKALLIVACRDGESIDTLRLLAFECIGILGAVDPDRFDMQFSETGIVVLNNFSDESEAMRFALHLVEHTLVGAFRSTSDIKYQSHLAFAIQELLKFCKFTPDLAVPGASIPLKVRTRWNSLPKHVLETVTPLLEARFAIHNTNVAVDVQHPIYIGQMTYREWIQLWTAHLITRASGAMAVTIFNAFRLTIRNKDVGVAHQLLPHLVLNILVSGNDDDTKNIRSEIIAILEDQLDGNSKSSSDKRLLSAQAIFMLMDHLNKWIRIVRQDIGVKRNESKRSRHNQITNDAEMQVTRVDSILASIDQVLVARAAFECKSYARSLMNFERQILTLRNGGSSKEDLQTYYDRLHEIYSHLDEPDGMEGISAFIMLPSIEHQIRQHESTGRWTSAQSCWEVRLQQSPDKLDYHLGLLRCLRNLGHYDSLRTHIQGVLVRNPEWEKALAGFRVEGAWMSGDWDSARVIIEGCEEEAWEMAIARLLLALRSAEGSEFMNAIAATRLRLGAPITAAGERGYRRAYDAVLKLHLVQDIELIRKSVVELQHGGLKGQVLPELFKELSHRLDSTLPTFRTREPILSIHRTAFSLSRIATTLFKKAIGRSWLNSAKIARKAGHWQTAYSAVLQAQECQAPFTFFQSAKLVKASGEPLRALYELQSALQANEERQHLEVSQGVIDLTEDMPIDENERRIVEGKAKLLRARWMQDSERYDASIVAKELSDLAHTLSDFESAHFRAGHFQDECYKSLPPSDKKNRGPRMNLFTVRAYAAAIRIGSKYAYQTIPRLLTLWLDMGEDPALAQGEPFVAINNEIKNAILSTPVYKWLTAFPQIVSRVDHKNGQVYPTLSQLIMTVLQEYPQQGLWLFMSVVKSTKPKREKRGKNILDQLKNNPRNAETAVPDLISQSTAMATELLRLCDLPIKDDTTRTLSMVKDVPLLARLSPSPLIIPLQESMTVSLPATSSVKSDYQPFPPDTPTILAFHDEIDIMKSLARPRKITLTGSDAKVYMFLGKPKDDLRKDARLMDFNSIINKLLGTNSESRRRQLRIRTYSVVTLNEECGFIQWVPNTTPVRPILLRYYGSKGIEPWNREMTMIFSKIKEVNDKDGAKIFQDKILSIYPPIFHEWFLDTFPEPTAWLSSRLAFGRTAAVMSMVGFILGLGDRHLENILLDVNSGDAVHVDFNCLFEKGKTLETPERVPFRLTQNIVDALGVTGVEGVFRNASEITLQLLRDNKDVLMSVLDAFIHDPLVEWEDEKRKMERLAKRGERDINVVKDSVDLRKLAKNALQPIERKLRGLYVKDTNRNDRRDKEVSTSNLVQMLIEEAIDLRNLAKMYPGWSSWH